MVPRVRVTPTLQALAVQLASRMPFGQAAVTLESLLRAAPAVALHRLLGRVGERRDQEDERRRRQVFETGEPGHGERRVSRLFVEADGKWVPLQRTPERRDLELCRGLAHEGWGSRGRRPLAAEGETGAFLHWWRDRLLGKLQRAAGAAV